MRVSVNSMLEQSNNPGPVYKEQWNGSYLIDQA